MPKRTLTNATQSPRAICTTGGWVTLQPGETRTVSLPTGASTLGFTVADLEGVSQTQPSKSVAEMDLPELRAFLTAAKVPYKPSQNTAALRKLAATVSPAVPPAGG